MSAQITILRVGPSRRSKAWKGGFRYADELGPSRIVHVYEPSVGLKGILVIDNVAAEPAIGGLHMAPDVSTEACVRIIRAFARALGDVSDYIFGPDMGTDEV